MIKAETFAQISDLHSKGGTIQGISRELRLNIKTVRKYVRKGEWQPYVRTKPHKIYTSQDKRNRLMREIM